MDEKVRFVSLLFQYIMKYEELHKQCNYGRYHINRPPGLHLHIMEQPENQADYTQEDTFRSK